MIAENIRRLCAERGTNLKQLEKTIGIGNGVIATWGTTSSPRVDTIKKVADFFGTTVDALIKEKE